MTTKVAQFVLALLLGLLLTHWLSAGQDDIVQPDPSAPIERTVQR